MAMGVILGRLKYSIQQAREQERKGNYPVSGTSVFSENCAAPRKSLMKFSRSIKAITLTQCSLQTDRNKLSRPHWRRNFPQSNVKTALDAENFFVAIIEKNRDQM